MWRSSSFISNGNAGYACVLRVDLRLHLRPLGNQEFECTPNCGIAPDGLGTTKSASVPPTCSRRHRFEADFIVNRISKPLLTAKVSLRRLDAHMTKQELDLLQLSAGLMTQAGTGTAQIVRSNTVQTAFRGPGLHDAQMTLGLKPVFPIPWALQGDHWLNDAYTG